MRWPEAAAQCALVKRRVEVLALRVEQELGALHEHGPLLVLIGVRKRHALGAQADGLGHHEVCGRGVIGVACQIFGVRSVVGERLAGLPRGPLEVITSEQSLGAQGHGLDALGPVEIGACQQSVGSASACSQSLRSARRWPAWKSRV